ncbi:hypothetical protein BRADI_3g37410v3 [Brachypodium distachyon]|uniref:RBR-type E3 ubiquitin transferase n=1 Tax=Brachypodium distachyon TaxID=15368 RepID=A0A0Q3FFX2_BRADI|nr:hypothetical protein BRADI_3g37410v3 [Brachypodium distachyon]
MAAGSSNADLTGLIDESYFSALTHARNDADFAQDDDLFPISDEKYAVELQFQEVIMSSAIAAAAALTRPRSSSLPDTLSRAMNTSPVPIVIIDDSSSAGASSSSSSRPSTAATPTAAALVFCKICMDAVPAADAHRASSGCAHAFCGACLAGYLGAKIQDRIADIRCPEEWCPGVLDPALCQGMLPREVFDRWAAALCESMVLGAKRVYCPFKDCSAMMVADGHDDEVTQSECQLGRGNRGKEDLMMLEMAKGKKWKRCPKCQYFVEKIDGCLLITCRCRYEFCYGCGNQWGVTHSSCISA